MNSWSIFSLHSDLINHTYKHGLYQSFKISDPKSHDIHKATVRDRLFHHAIYRVLYPFFASKFISDYFSCRLNKGAHKALKRFKKFSGQVSQNHTKACWVLKGDVRKCFASVDHQIINQILAEYIPKILASYLGMLKCVGKILVILFAP